jgi:hypothetical protein
VWRDVLSCFVHERLFSCNLQIFDNDGWHGGGGCILYLGAARRG